jgi:hypothetical protein
MLGAFSRRGLNQREERHHDKKRRQHSFHGQESSGKRELVKYELTFPIWFQPGAFPSVEWCRV